VRLVIPYRHDQANGLELRFALRSMAKHFKGMTGVLLIGEKPPWYRGDYLQAQDVPGKKEYSIYRKILLCPDPVFMLSGDDIFALKDFSSDLPLMYNDRLDKVKKWGRYVERYQNVQQLYPDGLNFDIHRPMPINLHEFQQANAPADWENKEYLQKSVYGNYVNGLRGGAVQADDYKFRRPSDFHVQIDRDFFSTSDYLARRVGLEKLFPDPSPYE
jgi:hypothetical protein